MKRRILLPVAAVAAVGALTAAGLYATAPDYRVWLRFPFGTVALLVTATVVGLWLVVGFSRRAVRKAREDGYRTGSAAEREAHYRFLARLDHELKNPITAIRAAVASAQGPACAAPVPGPSTEDQQPALSPVNTQLAIADGQAARLAALVSDLRKLADLEHQPIEAEEVSLEEVTREAVTDLTTELAAHGDTRQVTVYFPRVPWPLPAVRGDIDLLYVAIHNLLSNAAKYSPPGSPIEVRGSDERGWVMVDIADRGIGIPPDELPMVTQELTRGREARGSQGSGLGLALARVIVERHGGTLTLRSRHGEGTGARLWLPVPGRAQE